MKHTILLLCIAALLAACNPCKRAIKRGCYMHDTVTVTQQVLVHDTLTLPSDTVTITHNPDSLEVGRLTTLLDNARFMITALRNSKGEVKYEVVEKERKVPFTKLVPVVVRVPTLQPAPPETNIQKARRYALNSLAVIGALYLLWLLLFGKPRGKE